jgi:hypothetical protein
VKGENVEKRNDERIILKEDIEKETFDMEKLSAFIMTRNKNIELLLLFRIRLLSFLNHLHCNFI